jgi:hypothetical protein
MSITERDSTQLKQNRAKVFMIGAGLFLLGSQGPDISNLFWHHGDHRSETRNERIEIDRVDAAAERASELADRAALLAERAAEAAERASEAH